MPGEDRSNESDRQDDHLSDVADGCGCAEVWEHLSEQRNEDSRKTE